MHHQYPVRLLGTRTPYPWLLLFIFHIPEMNWTLKPPYFTSRLKQLGVHFGLDPSRISSHSLRIGGATTLAAAGLTDGDVRGVGDRKSNAFMQYVRKNVELFARAQAAMTSAQALTVQDVRRASETVPKDTAIKKAGALKRGRPKKAPNL